jgi:hypothetical protein
MLRPLLAVAGVLALAGGLLAATASPGTARAATAAGTRASVAKAGGAG